MAGRRRASYTAPAEGRHPDASQRRPAAIAVLVTIALVLCGCSTIIVPLSGLTSSSSEPATDDIATGSIPKPDPRRPSPESDADVVRRTIERAAQAPASAPVPIAWSNPTSGNSGTISELAPAKAANGAPCRDFATTLATIDGVRLYRGRACQGYTGPWDLVDFAPVERTPAG